MYNITQLNSLVGSGVKRKLLHTDQYRSKALDYKLYIDCGLGTDENSTITEEVITSRTGVVDPHKDLGSRTLHICILLSDTTVVFTQDGDYSMNAGDCVLIHSKVEHSARTVSSGTAKFMCVQYADNVIPQHMLDACINYEQD